MLPQLGVLFPHFLSGPDLARELAAEAEAALSAAIQAGAEAIVAAGCSLSARGLEALKYLERRLPASWVDLRESCAWVHARLPEEALSKAVDLLCSSLAALERRGAFAMAGAPEKTPARLGEDEVLIVGGGPAGLACAATLGQMGVKAALAERRAALGGMLPQLGVLFPHFLSGPDLARELAAEAEESGTRILLETTVAELEPVPEGYGALLRGKNGEEKHVFKAIVLAAGAMPALPRGYYRYGELPGVISQMELETSLGRVERGEKEASILPERSVFLQCVAARDDKNPYCSAICCPTALKNAIRLRALRPEGSVTVVHRNIVTPGRHLEALYRRAAGTGVYFCGQDPERLPEPVGGERLTGLVFRDALSGEEVLLPAEALVCSTPLKPLPATMKLAESIGLRLDDLGFACGREPIQPLSSSRAGLFVCGAARWPVMIEHSLEQGRAVAIKAAGFLRASRPEPAGASFVPGRPKILWELMPGAVPLAEAAKVEEKRCSRCGRCAAACPYGACFLPEDGGMRIIGEKCARCGSCAAVCPAGAVSLPGESLDCLLAGMREVLGGMRV
jgi:heterodisulfide reductase subunit A